MARRSGLLAAIAALAFAGVAEAQSTGMPSYNAPYRAFARHEFGGTLSFPEGDLTGIEGQYRFGYRTWDIGFRAGILDTPEGVDTEILAGVTGRVRVLTHSERFPLDGAVVVGVGGQFVEDGSTLIIPGGLSLGRRLDVEGSEVSIVPYAQPTMFLTATSGDTDVSFALGFGADFRLSRLFDLRASASVGDLEGFAISAVWVH